MLEGCRGACALQAAWLEALEWWSDHLERRNCVPMVEPPALAAARLEGGVVAGTDASGWGTGQLVWLDGAREEVQLEFTAAERKRWLELVDIGVLTGHDSHERVARYIGSMNKAAKATAAAQRKAEQARSNLHLQRKGADI